MNTSRRNFLKKTTAATATAGLMSSGLISYASPFTNLRRKVNPSDTVRLGIIGTGGRGTGLMRLIQDIEGMDIIACCDVMPFRLDEGMSLAAKGAKRYTDYRNLLENPDLDGVIISAPLYLHYEMAKAALDADLHIYCEKTMTFTIEEAKKLSSMVEASDKVFQVGYQHRYNPLFKQVNDIIHGDEFGQLSHIECYWNRNGNWRKPVPDPKWERMINWRMYKDFSGGLVAELSSHQINIVNWIMDDHPTRVMGFGGIDYWKDGRETYDNTHVTFEYAGGVKASYTCLTTNSQQGFRLMFYGKNATVEVVRDTGYSAYVYIEPAYLRSFEEEKKTDAVSAASPQWEAGKRMPIYQAEPGKEDAEPTGDALTAYRDCIRENKKPLVDYKSGAKSAICVDLANQAMYSGKVLHWDDFV